MVNLTFSYYDLEYFLLIFVRVSCFVFITPFFSVSNTPRRVRAALSVFVAMLLYSALAPAAVVQYDTVLEYAVIVGKEAITGLLLGFSTIICTSIVNFAGSIVDMETGLSMVTLVDPTTKENTSITGVFYQYILMMMLLVSGMYRYLIGALAQSYTLIPVNEAIIRGDNLLSVMLGFMSDYLIIGFRICLPVFCVSLLLNTVLGVMARVSPQMNMFAVGIQFKILVGLAVLFFTAAILPGMADFVFEEIKKMTVMFVGGMS